MKNYSDPAVWQAFLAEHGISSEAPPPPQELFSGTPEDLVDTLTRWADVMDPVRIKQEAAEDFAGLIEAYEEYQATHKE